MASDINSPIALIPIATGSEEIETVCLADVLTRGGVKVIIARVDGDNNEPVKMSRGVHIKADKTIKEVTSFKFDLIVLPGGMPGATHLRDSLPLKVLLEEQKASGRLYGAICASPAVVLLKHGLLNGLATSYPTFASDMSNECDYTNHSVVVSKNCITSRGPGTAMEMGIKLVELLCGVEKAKSVASGLLVPYPEQI